MRCSAGRPRGGVVERQDYTVSGCHQGAWRGRGCVYEMLGPRVVEVVLGGPRTVAALQDHAPKTCFNRDNSLLHCLKGTQAAELAFL